MKSARKSVSFEHSSMLRSACVEGNLELVKSLDFSGGSRDIDGKLRLGIGTNIYWSSNLNILLFTPLNKCFASF